MTTRSAYGPSSIFRGAGAPAKPAAPKAVSKSKTALKVGSTVSFDPASVEGNAPEWNVAMKKADLLDVAKKLGIKVSSSMSKAEIVDALTAEALSRIIQR